MPYAELPLHTKIFDENKLNGALFCGINHGYSKADALLDSKGVDRADPGKSFFSDETVHDYPFRNTLVKWMRLWGFPLKGAPGTEGPFERSFLQTNWLQTCSSDMSGVNVRQECVADAGSFLQICLVLQPGLLFLCSRELMWALNAVTLKPAVEEALGPCESEVTWIQRDVLAEGQLCKRFKFGFQRYANTQVVALPHPTGSRGLADAYIEAFKPELFTLIDAWWSSRHDAN